MPVELNAKQDQRSQQGNNRNIPKPDLSKTGQTVKKTAKDTRKTVAVIEAKTLEVITINRNTLKLALVALVIKNTNPAKSVIV